jgi:hypothetical protein
MEKRIRLALAMTFVFLGLLVGPCFSADESPNKGEGRGYFMIGGNQLDMDDLNRRLMANGFTRFSDDYISLGGGGHAIVNERIIIGGEGHALLGRTKSSTVVNVDYGSKLSAGYGFFDLGYVVLRSGGFDAYPLLGIGGGGISMNFVESEVGSFDDVLQNPSRGSKLSTWDLLVSVGFGMDHLYVLGGNEQGEGGLVLGLRAGYIFSPFEGDWKFEGETLPGGPDFGITGPYIRLMIGGGGWGTVD